MEQLLALSSPKLYLHAYALFVCAPLKIWLLPFLVCFLLTFEVNAELLISYIDLLMCFWPSLREWFAWNIYLKTGNVYVVASPLISEGFQLFCLLMDLIEVTSSCDILLSHFILVQNYQPKTISDCYIKKHSYNTPGIWWTSYLPKLVNWASSTTNED